MKVLLLSALIVIVFLLIRDAVLPFLTVDLPQTLGIRSILRRRGYEWIGFFQAHRILKNAGRAARRLPAPNELKAFGYTHGDVDSLLAAFDKCEPNRERNEVMEEGGVALGIGLLGPIFLFFPCFLAFHMGGTRVGWIVTGTVLGLVFSLAAGLFWRMLRVKRIARARGHDWVDLGDAFRLQVRLGRWVERMPTRKEFVSMPDCRKYDVQSLIDITRRICKDPATPKTGSLPL